MLFAQGRDLSGQWPDETNAVCRSAGNEVVVPAVGHSVYGYVLPIHAFKVAFLPSDINRIVAQVTHHAPSQNRHFETSRLLSSLFSEVYGLIV